MSISPRKRFEVFERDDYRCQYCGRGPKTVELHVDHVHPKSAGGSDKMGNLITACRDCNLGKGALKRIDPTYEAGVANSVIDEIIGVDGIPTPEIITRVVRAAICEFGLSTVLAVIRADMPKDDAAQSGRVLGSLAMRCALRLHPEALASTPRGTKH